VLSRRACPICKALFNGPSAAGKALALSTFQAHRTSYHSIAQKMIGRDLGV
jgi:hypothetical protein